MARKKKETAGEVAGHAAVSFVGGLIFTLIFIVAVPVICDAIIQPRVEEIVGDTAFMWFSSSLIVTLIMLLVLVLFSLLLGGSAILKRFGWIGVIALIAAYYLMGNIEGAIIPVICIVLMILWQHHRDGGKGKKKRK